MYGWGSEGAAEGAVFEPDRIMVGWYTRVGTMESYPWCCDGAPAHAVWYGAAVEFDACVNREDLSVDDYLAGDTSDTARP